MGIVMNIDSELTGGNKRLVKAKSISRYMEHLCIISLQDMNHENLRGSNGI